MTGTKTKVLFHFSSLSFCLPECKQQWFQRRSSNLIILILSFAFTSAVVASSMGLNGVGETISGSLTPSARRILGLLTELGKSDWLLIPSGLAFLFLMVFERRGKNRRWRAHARQLACLFVFLFLAIAISGILALLIKYGLGVPRPKIEGELPGSLIGPTMNSAYASFPSGHATTMGALFMVLYLLWPRIGLVFLPVALLISASRFALNAHFVSDVVTGFALGGWTSFLIGIWFAERQILFRFSPQDFPVMNPISGIAIKSIYRKTIGRKRK